MTIIAIYGHADLNFDIDGVESHLPQGISLYMLGNDGVDSRDWLGLKAIGKSVQESLLFTVAPSSPGGAYSELSVEKLLEVIDVLVAKFAALQSKK